jgi:hypothetical protein
MHASSWGIEAEMLGSLTTIASGWRQVLDVLLSNAVTLAQKTYLLAQFAEESQVICTTLMGLQFLGKCSEHTSSHRDVTWHHINIS